MNRPAGSTERPTRAALAAAAGVRIPDVVAPGLRVLFVGINPGLYSGAVGHHFARPGNRFWPALHAAGFTPRVLSPFEDRSLLDLGVGITNLVARTTARADELTAEELQAGGVAVTRKARRLRPAFVAFVGITAYRIAYARPRATVGEQDEPLAASRVWVLPNPSGLNARYQAGALTSAFRALREAAWPSSRAGAPP